MTEPERCYSVEEIVARLGVPKETIDRWVEKEKIPAHQVTQQWTFKVSTVSEVSTVDEWVLRGLRICGCNQVKGSKR